MSDGADSGDETAPSEPKDVLFVGSPATEGGGAPVLRVREGRVETGELREAQEGKPIVGELVKLSKRPEHERLFNVEVLAKGPEPKPARALEHKGPARVATDKYRQGWDAIFGARPGTEKPN
ncbi:MAG: hypothetical protein HOV80_13510 [Polyangiaceae bacterium]|nr:hypothetical protein [Polyangiaceae bacterium]